MGANAMAIVCKRGDLRLLEPVPVDDELCSGGLAMIEDLDFGARFVLANRETMYETGEQVLIVKRKIVLQDQIIPPGLAMACDWVARRAMRYAGAKIFKFPK